MPSIVRKIVVVLAALLSALPVAAGAAELPLPPLHRTAHVHPMHRLRIVRLARPHFGYYWGRWGWRWGGTARSWYGSTFAFGALNGAGPLLESSPRGVASIDCSGPRPFACLAEPVVRPVAWSGRWIAP